MKTPKMLKSKFMGQDGTPYINLQYFLHNKEMIVSFMFI